MQFCECFVDEQLRRRSRSVYKVLHMPCQMTRDPRQSLQQRLYWHLQSSQSLTSTDSVGVLPQPARRSGHHSALSNIRVRRPSPKRLVEEELAKPTSNSDGEINGCRVLFPHRSQTFQPCHRARRRRPQGHRGPQSPRVLQRGLSPSISRKK